MRPDPPQLSLEQLDAAVELMGRSGRIGRLRVRGTSMVPTVRAGQWLAVDFKPEGLARGDVVLFRLGEVLIVHRLVGRSRRGHYRMRGDGRIRLDPPVYPEQILGRVVAIRDDGGWRGFRSRRARLYGRLLAGHDFVWAAAGVVLRRFGLEAFAHRVERFLLRRVHRLCFEHAHPRVPEPEATAEAP